MSDMYRVPRFRSSPSRRAALLTALVLLAGSSAGAQQFGATRSLSAEAALPHFERARGLSHADGGKLWGKKLYGPMLLVDPVTRRVMANWRDKTDLLVRDGRLWTGSLPAEIAPTNTITEMGGVTTYLAR